MRWVIAGIAGLMLSGCDAPDHLDKSGAGEREAEHTIDPETGEVRMIIPHKDGTATLRSGPNVPVTLPRGISMVPGARVLAHSQFAMGDGQGSLVTFEADVEAPAVIAHFRDQARAAGFAVTLENDAAGTLMIVGERKRDGARLAVTATAGEPTTGQIVVSTIPTG